MIRRVGRIVNDHMNLTKTIQGIEHHRIGVLVGSVVEGFLPNIFLHRPKILDVVFLEKLSRRRTVTNKVMAEHCGKIVG